MNRHRDRLTALAIALLLHLAIAVGLGAAYLSYSSTTPPPEWPPVDSAELLLGGEYVHIGDAAPAPEADTQEAAPAPADEPVDVAPAPEEVGNTPVAPPVPARPKPEPVAPPVPTPEEQERARTADAIKNRVTFGTQAATDSEAGQRDGDTHDNAAASGASVDGLGSRRAQALPAPPAGPLGTVIIAVKVDRRGNVVEATFAGGTGAAAASADTRANCLSAARNAKFTPDATAPELQAGRITYNYR